MKNILGAGIILMTAFVWINATAEGQCMQGARGDKVGVLTDITDYGSYVSKPSNPLKQYSAQAYSNGCDTDSNDSYPRMFVYCYKSSGDQRCRLPLYGEQSARCNHGDRMVIWAYSGPYNGNNFPCSSGHLYANIYELSTDKPICATTANTIFSSVLADGTSSKCSQTISGANGVTLSLTPTEITIPPSGSDSHAYYQCGSGDKVTLEKGQKVSCCAGDAITTVIDGTTWDTNSAGFLEATIQRTPDNTNISTCQ